MKSFRQIAIIMLTLGLAAITMIAFYNRQASDRFAPLYGRVLLGPDSSNPVFSSSLIVSGSQIFIDSNDDGIGQETEKFEASRTPAEFTSPTATAVRYRLTDLRLGMQPDLVSETLPQQLAMEVHVDGDQSQSHVRAGEFALSPSRESPGQIHFGGSLVIQLADAELQMFASPASTLQLKVSLESAESGLPVTVVMPGDVIPVAEIHFPAANDHEPIVKRYDLDEFC